MAALRLLIVLICSVALILAQETKSDTKTTKKSGKAQKGATKPNARDTATTGTTTTTASASAPDYGATIQEIQSQLSKINVDELSQYVQKVESVQTKLSALIARLDSFEKKLNDANVEHGFLDLTNKAVNDLEGRIERVEKHASELKASVNSKSSDTSSSAQDVDGKIAKLQSRVTREIDNNAKRLEMMEESVSELQLESVRREIKALSDVVGKASQRNDDLFKQVRERFAKLEENMAGFNQNLQIVYDNTLGAALNRWMQIAADYLADFGEFCLYLANAVVEKIKSFPWQAIYETATDPKQQQLFKEWLMSCIDWFSFWWNEGVVPTVKLQSKQISHDIRATAQEWNEYIHTHELYRQLMMQATPYMEMATIPKEYNGYVLDAFLVIFTLSTLWTFSFIVGLFCDCVCPRKRAAVADADAPVMNGIPSQPKQSKQPQAQQQQQQPKQKKGKRQHERSRSSD